MKIVILGAGQVGSSVARSLAGEANDITVVDRDPALLATLQEHLDIRAVAGHAAHPDVLARAGLEDADLMLAVTSSDETNMVACQVAHSLFNTPKRLARVRAAAYLDRPELFDPAAIPVDVLISPEALVTEAIASLIEHPATLQILELAGGRARLVAVRAHPHGALVGKTLGALSEQLPGTPVRVVAVFRHDRMVNVDGDTVVQSRDEVFFLAAREDVQRVVGAFRNPEGAIRRVIIAGGGNIGARLAGRIEKRYRVKIIEPDERRCRHLAEQLDRTLVLRGDATDAQLLIDEGIAEADMYCALTDDDEANILSAMLAKQLGARRAMSIVNRMGYVEVAQGAAVDIAISPAQVTIGALLTHVRRGDVVSVHSLRRGAAEAIEVIAHGDERSSRIVARRIADIPLPDSTVIGGLVREDRLVLARDDLTVESGDQLILFIADKKRLPEVERLFQVAFSFL